MNNCVAHTSVGERGVRKECAQWILSAIKLPPIPGFSSDGSDDQVHQETEG